MKGEIKIKEEKEDIALQGKIQDSEVVNALKFALNTAGDSIDEEALSSENERQQNSQQRSKPLIVKESPNSSTLEVASSSKAEELQIDHKNSENNANNENPTFGRKSLDTPSSSTSDQSSIDSDSDTEGCSLCNEEMYEKAVTNRKEQSVRNPTPDLEVDEESTSEDEVTSQADRAKKQSRKNLNKAVANGKSNSKSEEDEAESEHPSNGKNKENGIKKNKKNMTLMQKRIMLMQKYLRTAGIRVKYIELWSGCKFDRERIDRMKKLLEERGIVGRPTLEKCKRLKSKNERIQEAAQLDPRNIISEGFFQQIFDYTANDYFLGQLVKLHDAAAFESNEKFLLSNLMTQASS